MKLIRRNRTELFCRVCGLIYIDYLPWGNDNNSPTNDICDCCGCEFGYEDCNLNAIKSYRDNWIKNNYEWFNNKYKPSNWGPLKTRG